MSYYSKTNSGGDVMYQMIRIHTRIVRQLWPNKENASFLSLQPQTWWKVRYPDGKPLSSLSNEAVSFDFVAQFLQKIGIYSSFIVFLFSN